jgi:hypothetical protein
MGMADNYYTPKDDPEIECVSCDGDDEECSACHGTGLVDTDAICNLCDSYPCRCDSLYDSWKDSREDW